MPRTTSLLVVAVVLGGCAQVDAAPPPSLADQLAASVDERTDAVAVAVGEQARVGAVVVRLVDVAADTVWVATDVATPRATPSTTDVADSS